MPAESQKRNKKAVLTLIIAVSLIVIVLIIAFTATYAYNKIAKFNIAASETETIKAFADSMAEYTDARFNTAISRLEGYAVSFTDAASKTDEEITEKLALCVDNAGFASLAYVSSDGRTCTSGEMDANPRVHASSALTGSNVVVPTEKVYAVPVKGSDGVITGALVGISGDVSEEYEAFAVFNITGASYILDQTGVIVSLGQDPVLDLHIGDNLVTTLSVENDTNLLKASLSQKNVLVSHDLTYKGEKYISAIASLNTQGWTLVSMVPVSVVIENSDDIITSMNYLIFGLTVVFVVLAIYLLYHTHKIRVRAEEVAEENLKINYIDDITGYSSWKGFMENYEKARLDTSVKRAFISLDVDKFKTINDTLGYDGGNRILKQLAEIIARDIGKNDIFARNGSDHFFILAEYKEKEDVIDLVNHIISDISYQISEIRVTVSIGIYLITDNNLKIRAVTDRANIARSSIKNLSESCYVFFDPSMIENIREEKNIENIMEDALEKGEFVVYLQPKYGLTADNLIKTGEVIGAEALVRWYHDGQIISPGKFIPIFEKNGFVTKLDFYMFREVCRLQKTWQSMGHTPKVISVNMSRLHFPDPNFVQTLKGYCDEFGIDTKYFEIEVTESAAYENINILMDVFSRIKAAGFHVSIDDFGTGYSSLNMLKDLPVDVLKIDRSFLTEDAEEEENASKIIACVVSLASSLDIHTICEGIETREQAMLLSKLGCDMAQGFYFARPMPVKEFEKLVYNIE